MSHQPLRVTLTQTELLIVGIVAASRNAQNMVLDRKERHGATDDSFDSHYVGAMGECAVAKALNKFWSGAVGDLRAKDVGMIQVRASRLPAPSLLLHHEDDDGDRFVCASVKRNVAMLHGWLFGREGKLQKFWRENVERPAFFAPIAGLHELVGRGS